VRGGDKTQLTASSRPIWSILLTVSLDKFKISEMKIGFATLWVSWRMDLICKRSLMQKYGEDQDLFGFEPGQ
jgi:hypothetical protein